MFRELAAVLDALASDVPLLLVLEDLQWADAATIECLRIIGRRHMPSRLCVVATYCGSHDLPAVAALERLGRALEPAGACTIIGLAPLTEAQLSDLHDPVRRRRGARSAARSTARAETIPRSPSRRWMAWCGSARCDRRPQDGR
jgi:hypothetical protein